MWLHAAWWRLPPSAAWQQGIALARLHMVLLLREQMHHLLGFQVKGVWCSSLR